MNSQRSHCIRMLGIAPFLSVLTLSLAAALANASEVSATIDHQRVIIELNGTWQGRTMPGVEIKPAPQDDGQWKTIQLPNGNAQADDGSRLIQSSPYAPAVSDLIAPDGKQISRKWHDNAAAWFRRSFEVEADWLQGRRALLHLEGAGPRHKVWFNGKSVGESMVGLVPASYDVTELIRTDGPNELVIAIGNVATLVDVENRTLLAPASGAKASIWAPVELHLLPPTYIEDVFITTSVKDEQLTARVTMNNTTDQPAIVRLTGLVSDVDGRAMTHFEPLDVSLAPGETTTITLMRSWIAPTLWSPGSPKLYHLSIDASQNGKRLDRWRRRFGFREFEIRGKDFFLNGQRITLLRNSTLNHLSRDSAGVFENARQDAGQPYNCWRPHIGFNNPANYEAADQVGLLTIPESAWHNISNKFNFERAELWLPNVEAYTRGLIRQHRNRPSVIMWNLTNESMWDRIDNLRMGIAQRVLEAAKQADDTRPFSADGDNSWDGRLDTINIHYPHNQLRTDLAQRYPNAGLLYPNMFDWLKNQGVNHSWRAEFIWDRPLIIGEYWHAGGHKPSQITSFHGELAYDWQHERFDSYAGHGGEPEDPAMWALKGMTDYYRLQGVAGLNPWYGDRREAMPPIAVRPIDYHPNFFADETGSRKVVIFNDTPEHYSLMRLQCRLMVDGQMVWHTIIPSHVGPGASKVVDIPIDLPAVQSPTPAKLAVRLKYERGRHWKTLARYQEEIYLWPKASLTGLDTQGFVVVQQDPTLEQVLKMLGLNIAVQSDLNKTDLTNAHTVLLGPGVKVADQKHALMEFVREGGRLIQLNATAKQSLAGAAAAPIADPLHAATRSWILTYGHPVLAGLKDGMFSFWRPDNLVSRQTLRKQFGTSTRYVIHCGGNFGMQWSPLAETSWGKGIVIQCQMPLVSAAEQEPAAGMLLARLIRYAQHYTPSPVQPLTVLASPDHSLFEALFSANVNTTTQLEMTRGQTGTRPGPVLVHASTDLSNAQVAELKRRLDAGGKVWLSGFNPTTVQRIAALLPFEPTLKSFDASETQGAVVRSKDALIENVSAQQFAWYHYQYARGGFFAGSSPTAELGRFVLQPPDLESAHKLVEPGLLYKVPVGKGTVLFDTLLWPGAVSHEHDKVAMLVGSLAMNLGASVMPGSDAENYTYIPVDISGQANMGFYDPVAHDGQGGWTDQGSNDMRFFLTNHVGRAGGLASGMEVATRPMPAEVEFLGRPFKMIDPKDNNGKAVISLRGTNHGTKLPARVEGIPVNDKADRLWFLHTAGWVGPPGQEAARYIIHYDDGTQQTLTVRCNQEIGDWWQPRPLPKARVAWTGHNLKRSPIGLYLTSWDNPHPNKVIRSIDAVGNLSPTQVVLVAVTAGVQKSD